MIAGREGLERGEFNGPQPPAVPVKRPYPGSWVRRNRPRRSDRIELQEKTPKARFRLERRVRMSRPSRVRLVVPSWGDRSEMFGPASFDDFLRLEERLVRKR